MPRLRPLLQFAIPILVLCVALAAPAAYADDAVKEDTPAGKAFRDAWWAETGAGKLDQALDGYRTALAAEGSEAVRARALYRMGLVLQRMGRTDEALRAMQRLADEFPGQSALLARAKERLEEWTAVDLRDQFPEWYKRYQYSPEFQAKIVDLVLKLGATDGKTQSLARNELLTIGEPAIPALRQHTGSANRNLARNVNGLLLSLGQLPPAAGLFVETSWYRSGEFWKLLRGADEATQATYRQAAAAQKDDWLPRWVLATIDGPDAMLAELRTAASSGSVLNAVLVPWFADGAASPGFFAALRAMVLDDSVPSMVRSALAYKLMPAFDYEGGEPHPYGLSVDEVVAWAKSEDSGVRQSAWTALQSGYIHSQAALDAVTARVLAQGLASKERGPASGAIFGVLRMRASTDGAEDAVRVLAMLLEERGTSHLQLNGLRDWGADGRGSPVIPTQVFAAAIGRAQGKYVGNLVDAYMHQDVAGASAAEKQRQLLAWAVEAADGEVRRDAMTYAARQARADPRALTAPLAREEATAGLVQAFFNGLNSGNATLIPWDAESATRMVVAAERHFDRDITLKHTKGRFTVAGVQIQFHAPYQGVVSWVFANILHDGPSVPVFLEAAVAHPARFDGDVWYVLGDAWKEQPASRRLVLQALQRGWQRWTPAQREAGLDALLRETTILEGNAETDVLLRRLLRSDGNTPAVRSRLLEYVSRLSLDDVRSTFDLSDPQAVDQAAALVSSLPRTREVYDVFVPALRADGEQWQPVFRWFKFSEDEDLLRDMLGRMLSHGWHMANAALDFLKTRNKASDLPLWIQALAHENGGARRMAAQRLGRLYDDAAMRALARAVDDPDPEVRDAVLASLERIQKTEAQKKRWREFAQTGKLPTDDR